jgi:type II secretory pathway component PulJ
VVKVAGFTQLMIALSIVAALGAIIVLFLPNEAQMNAHLKSSSGNHL